MNQVLSFFASISTVASCALAIAALEFAACAVLLTEIRWQRQRILVLEALSQSWVGRVLKAEQARDAALRKWSSLANAAQAEKREKAKGGKA